MGIAVGVGFLRDNHNEANLGALRNTRGTNAANC
jgi:hypothetical protein